MVANFEGLAWWSCRESGRRRESSECREWSVLPWMDVQCARGRRARTRPRIAGTCAAACGRAADGLRARRRVQDARRGGPAGLPQKGEKGGVGQTIEGNITNGQEGP